MTDPAPPPAPPPTPPPTPPPAGFDPATFMHDLDAKMNAWGERTISGIKEAFPTPVPPPTETPPKGDDPPSKEDPPKGDPPKDTLPENDPPTPGKRKSFAEWWFGQ